MLKETRVNRFKVYEAEDEAQIVKEIHGERIDNLVYTVEGRPVLSYAGVRFAASKLGGLHVKSVSCEYNEGLDQFEATVLALNERANISLPGSAEQPAHSLVDDISVVDVFARRKAVSKATRNVLLALMPQSHISKVLQEVLRKEATHVYEASEDSPLGVVAVPSVKSRLVKLGLPVDLLMISLDHERNMVIVMPTTFLDSADWENIDSALGSCCDSVWIRSGNRWEIKT